MAIVPLLVPYALDYSALLVDYSPVGAISINLLAYSAYIYLDFSGYSDIAVGTAYLVGIKTPENFNNPYFSINLAEFWKNWHITFSNFLRLYVFMPFVNLYNSIFNPKHRMFVTIMCYLSTFLICGLWHGDTVNFVYWGLWHGVGLSINKIWTVMVVADSQVTNALWYKVGSVVITFVFVTIGWVFFNYSSVELLEIYSMLL
jgi:alginate O-acetyltransferase complex protein AlgI